MLLVLTGVFGAVALTAPGSEPPAGLPSAPAGSTTPARAAPRSTRYGWPGPSVRQEILGSGARPGA